MTTSQNTHSENKSPPFNNINPLVRQGSPPSQSMVVNYNWDKDEPMDYTLHSETTLPIGEGIMRGEQHLPSISHFPNNIELTTPLSQMYDRQISEEQNFKQPLNNSKHVDKRSVLDLDNRARKNNFQGHSPTTPVVGGNPIQMLQQLATLQQFKPDEEFKMMILEKKREEEHKRNHCSGPKNENLNTSYFTDHANHQRPRQRTDTTLKTFPLRVRSSPDGHFQHDSSKPGTLMKSFSMPNDMKPAECHKG